MSGRENPKRAARHPRNLIPLARGVEIPILFENRSVLALDKPAGWMLAPSDWTRTGRNLQLALMSSIAARDFWAKSRNLKFLRFVHRLDAETSGALLLAKSAGAVPVYSRLFESRQMDKHYFVVVKGMPRRDIWRVEEPISPEPGAAGRMRIDRKAGKDAVTDFEVLARTDGRTLLRAKPLTGRTHQIRLHLASAGYPVLGDKIYGSNDSSSDCTFPLALRAVALRFTDPFTKRRVTIETENGAFWSAFGFSPQGQPMSPE